MQRQRRRVTRIVLLVLLFAVGGAIVNVAVAWGCALWVPIRIRSIRVPTPKAFDLQETLVNGEPAFVADSIFRMQSTGSAFGVNSSGLWKGTDGDGLMIAGWPMRSLNYSWRFRNGKNAGFENAINLKVIRSISRDSREALPIQLVWPGFAINTIFYAAVLWMVFAFPFVVRRRRRIKRGLCPACAYPVGASPVCTECGKAVKQSAISGQQSAEVQS